VDLRDEQAVKFPSALLMTAEMDDTFGIFQANVKPRSYSTPNCLQRKKIASSSSNSASAWDSPSFLVNLNDAFVRGSSCSDFSVSTNNQTDMDNSNNQSSQNLSVDSKNGNTDEQTANPVETRPSPRVIVSESESDKNGDSELRPEHQQFNFMSPIVRLEGSSAHEDRTSVEGMDNSADSGKYFDGPSFFIQVPRRIYFYS